MEFILVLVLFSAALIMLSIGQLLGGKQIHGSCKSHKAVDGINVSCGACSQKDTKLDPKIDKAGLQNVSKLGYPSRTRPFSQNEDFKPDRFN